MDLPPAREKTGEAGRATGDRGAGDADTTDATAPAACNAPRGRGSVVGTVGADQSRGGGRRRSVIALRADEQEKKKRDEQEEERDADASATRRDGERPAGRSPVSPGPRAPTATGFPRARRAGRRRQTGSGGVC